MRIAWSFFVSKVNVVAGQPVFKLLIGCDEAVVQPAGNIEQAQLAIDGLIQARHILRNCLKIEIELRDGRPWCFAWRGRLGRYHRPRPCNDCTAEGCNPGKDVGIIQACEYCLSASHREACDGARRAFWSSPEVLIHIRNEIGNDTPRDVCNAWCNVIPSRGKRS